jgi:hypothetical protein
MFETMFPAIAWRRPLKISVGRMERLCCRLCIARFGIKASEVAEKGFLDDMQFCNHILEKHQ